MRKASFQIVFALVLGGCATTGSTMKSGVGERRLDQPPYYAGVAVYDTGAIGHLRIEFQRGATDSEIFDPKADAGTPLHALITDMNRYLDSLSVTKRIDVDVSGRARGTPPDVEFGCEAGSFECEASEDYRLRLAVARPSRSWIDV